jgi:hypothetical protein
LALAAAESLAKPFIAQPVSSPAFGATQQDAALIGFHIVHTKEKRVWRNEQVHAEVRAKKDGLKLPAPAMHG